MVQYQESPKLVVMTGYPSSGKSRLTNYLVKEYGFVRLDFDLIRNALYGGDFSDLNIGGEQKSSMLEAMVSGVDLLKIHYLSKGFNVVVDSAAPTNKSRQERLDTKLLEKLSYSDLSNLDVQKYLFCVSADREIISQRNLQRGRDPIKGFEIFDSIWEDPVEEGYELINFQSTTEQDFIESTQIIDELFGIKNDKSKNK